MRDLLIISFLFLVSLGCENKELQEEVVIQEESKISPTHIAIFEVEGMMCQKGCGAAIRKGLYETGGVSTVEVSFDEENPVNEIKVYFDIKLTSTEKMIDVIGGLADERYSAQLKKVTESTLSMSRSNSEESLSNNRSKSIPTREISTESFSFPNLTQLLNGLIN